MALETRPPKSSSGRLNLAMQNGGGRYNGVNSIGYGSLGRGAMKPGFFVSFLVDARGGKMHGKRHSGVDLIIPPSKVCMPTRITCKLIRKEKLIHPPPLKEGEALASRIAELGPVGEKFLGAVLIELPHFASRISGERELVILRSENGISWHEHQSQTPSDALLKLIENEEEISKEKRVVRIFTADFPRYFVAVTRIRQDSKIIGSSGGAIKASISDAVATFPGGATGKDIKVGLQVLPIAPENILRVVGQAVALSAVTTIEPRRRKFRSPVTLTIPVPKEMQDSIRKQKKSENPAVHILYSITGGGAPSQWEDITGSAPLNLVNDAVSFSTIVSARYWLMDCRNLQAPIKAANELFQNVVAAPFLAKFYILVKYHSLTEAQVRVLCMTDDDIESTFERQERFAIIGSSMDVEVFEGKPYYLDIVGNFKPVAASGQELVITFHSFRVNRLSFVAHIVDSSQPPTAQLFLNKELVTPSGKRVEPPLFTLTASLPSFDAGLVSPDLEPEQWKAKLEAAKLSLAQDRPPVGAALRLTDIAEALLGDWVLLATQLGISPREIVKIQTEFGSAPEQAILMLHLWVEKHGGRVTAIELERALRKIGRDDIVDQCVYDSSAGTSAIADERDSLNPIDSSFMQQDHLGLFDHVQLSRSEIEPHPYVEVDEGVEYQVEEVWDGTQWHKTRIAVKKPEEPEPTEPTIWNDLATNGGDLKIESTLSERSEEIPANFVPGGYLTSVKEEEVNPLAPTNAEQDQPLVIESSVQVPQNDESPAVEMEHTYNTGADFDEHGGSGIPSTGRTAVGGASEVKMSSDISFGDPKVTTEVEEFEETLEDGSVVKRKVVRTKQEQLVTESFVISGPDSAFDSINNEEQISRWVTAADDSLSSPGTVVTKTEEMLDDGTVVKHTVTKTTEKHIDTDETL